MSLLGVHCSTSGGLDKAFIEAHRLGIDTFQIFSRNQRQWKAKPVSEEEKKLFMDAWKNFSSVKIIFTHASYLINLASTNEELRLKSIQAITEEVIRCDELGLAFTVLHPGAAGDNTMSVAIENIADALKAALKNTKGRKSKILLENTAGQGSAVGHKFQHLADIMSKVGSDRIGVCFDTCHAFVSGYDIRNEKSFDATIKEFDSIIGLKNLHAIHLNDSKGDFGSKLDRHENIGQGKIGKEAFRLMLETFNHIPKVLETPKEENWDAKNLETLRKLIK